MWGRLTNGSNPRPDRKVSAGGAGPRQPAGGGFFVGRRGPGGVGTFVREPTKYGYNRVRVPYTADRSRKGCKLPISQDCSRLDVTAAWALNCFYPTYRKLRAVHGDNFDSIYDDLRQKELPTCSLGAPITGAEYELFRRVAVAIAVLMNSEGVPVHYPQDPIIPRPARADRITQPWLRALLTGWL